MHGSERQRFFEQVVYLRLWYAAREHVATAMTIADVMDHAASLYEDPDQLASVLGTDSAERRSMGLGPTA
jgi:hypothetical protein